MGRTRRGFTPEYKDEAVKLVINTGRTAATERGQGHYADLRIMPMWMGNPLQDSGLVLVRSA